jgi:hypothetical protein
MSSSRVLKFVFEINRTLKKEFDQANASSPNRFSEAAALQHPPQPANALMFADVRDCNVRAARSSC